MTEAIALALPATSAPAPAAPTAQERAEALMLGYQQILSSCRWCWGQHPGACPFIRSVEWHPNGQMARIVLKERAEHESAVVYPEDEDSTT